MEEYIEDLLKIYNSSIDSYNSKIMQTLNGKYTIIDKAMLASYLYIKILTKLKIEEKISKEVLKNYLLKQIIYGETGNLSLEISDKSIEKTCKEVIEKLIIDKFESKNKITSCKDETDEKREYPIVVLVNEATASAAEVLASALHDSYGATIVGKKTYGKGKVQKMRQYEGSIVKYTSAKWLRPNGECIDEIGIVPEYEVDLLIENNTIYDKQLDKAIELLNK